MTAHISFFRQKQCFPSSGSGSRQEEVTHVSCLSNATHRAAFPKKKTSSIPPCTLYYPFLLNKMSYISNYNFLLGNSVLRLKIKLNKKYIKNKAYQSSLLMASPYPGVSTTVRRSFTPRSSISTVEASICTVRSIFSECQKHNVTNQRPAQSPSVHDNIMPTLFLLKLSPAAPGMTLSG